jgi:hypothetical protein
VLLEPPQETIAGIESASAVITTGARPANRSAFMGVLLSSSRDAGPAAGGDATGPAEPMARL